MYFTPVIFHYIFEKSENYINPVYIMVVGQMGYNAGQTRSRVGHKDVRRMAFVREVGK